MSSRCDIPCRHPATRPAINARFGRFRRIRLANRSCSSVKIRLDANLFETRKDIRAAAIEYQWAHQAAPDWAVTMWCLADVYAAQEEVARAEDLVSARSPRGAGQHLRE